MKKRGDKTLPCRSPTPSWNGFDCLPFTRAQTSNLQKNDLMARSNWRSTPYSCRTFQSLSRGTRSYAFSKSTKHAKRLLPCSQDFSAICFRVKTWSVVLQPGRKPQRTSFRFDSTISPHFLLRHLAYIFPGKLKSYIFLKSRPQREGRYWAPKSYWGPQALSGLMQLNNFLSDGCRFSFKSEGITIFAYS